MPTTQTRYGRPKGSGLDDRQRLESIAALLATDPELKPTTAIRALGIEEPSVIRRLRDKFRAQRPQLMDQARSAARARSTVPSEPPPPQAETIAPPAPQTSSSARTNTQGITGAGWEDAPAACLTAWFGVGISAINTAVENQAAITQHWLRLPTVSLAFGSQLAANAFALRTYARGKYRLPRTMERNA